MPDDADALAPEEELMPVLCPMVKPKCLSNISDKVDKLGLADEELASRPGFVILAKWRLRVGQTLAEGPGSGADGAGADGVEPGEPGSDPSLSE